MNLRIAWVMVVCAGTVANCASFRSELMSETSGEPRLIRGGVAFSTAGFRDEEQASEVLRTELENLGMQVNPDSDLRIRAARFELESGNPLALLNALVTIFTAGIVPFYHPVKERVTYTLFEKGHKKSECEYETKNNELFGLLLIPLSPFFWPGSQQQSLLRETAREAAVCMGLGTHP